MQVTEYNDVKVYNLSAGKSLPQFLEEAKKNQKSLRTNEDFRRRLDLIQDFEFNIASSRVRVSPDGEYIAATGVYPPEVRLFETRELGMKCARGLEHDVVDFLFLGDDYRKIAFLLDDRTVELHSQYGRHHRLRVPKAGRSLCYDSESCVLFVGGSSAEVMRLDLEAGTFLPPVAMQRLEEVHHVCANPVMPVLSCSGDSGLVESYDLRDPTQPLLSLQVSQLKEGLEQRAHVTSCAYSESGMHFAAGTAAGIVKVYDIRSSRPVTERNHMNGFPIVSVCFHAGEKDSDKLLVGSADTRSVKIWDASSGSMKASVESTANINHLTFCPRSGLFFCANDQQRVGVFFVPSIGLAPKWCSFLDNITEELEESTQKTVYEDYQFVTTEMLEQLGASELVGTKFLQPYMHGYFMDHRLHGKLKAAANPFAFDEYRKQRIRDKVDQKRKMRTTVRKSKVDVNPELHRKLQEDVEDSKEQGSSQKRRKAGDKAKSLLTDERFQALFADPDFAIAEKGPAAEFQAASASISKALAGKTAKPHGKKSKKGRE
mmetsp:Transcript_85534/g.133652  ORF Transcript_85534/g.133652 Transcript_85534/m.133652 type:complete len:544 (+) Transcript_85534:52-1683(+)